MLTRRYPCHAICASLPQQCLVSPLPWDVVTAYTYVTVANCKAVLVHPILALPSQEIYIRRVMP